MQGKLKDENLFKDVFFKLSEAVLIIDSLKGEVQFINQSGEELLDLRQTDIIGRNITEFFFRKESFDHLYEKMIKQLEKRDDCKIEIKIKRGKRKHFWGKIRFSLIKDANNQVKHVVFLIRDNTVNVKFEESWTRMQEQLRALTSHIQHVREEERIHIARELHDELSPVLTVLKMDLVNISRTLEEKEKTDSFDLIIGKITKMEGTIDDTIGVIRRIITELRPGILDDLGLIPAIEWLVDVFKKKSEVSFSFITDIYNIDLGKSQVTAVFRIFQESLTNILRHAQAKMSIISIKKKKMHLEMKISDDGVGIKESDLFAKKSFGLMGMRERAEFFGWELNILRASRRGTVVKLKIPLTNQGGAR